MINYDAFAKFNLLDSASLEDVRRLTSNEIMFHDIQPNEVRTLDYCSSDEMKKAGEWSHADFKYDINYYGFRMREVPHSVDIGVFGCSFTFGYGLPVSGLWHTLLGQTLNQSVANFGINGLSATSAIDVFLIASNHIKIKKAIFLLPQFERYQITKTDVSTGEINYLNIIPNHNSRLCNCYGVDSEQIYKAVPEEQMFRDVRNSLYIAEHIANQRNIDVYVSTWSNKSYKLLEQMNFSHMKLLPEWRHPTEIGIDVARDGKHPGFKLNQYFANLITPHI